MPLRAQKAMNLVVKLLPENNELLKKVVKTEITKDSAAVYHAVEKVLNRLQYQGYLLAEVKSIRFNQHQVDVLIEPNLQYQLVYLSVGNLSPAAKRAIGYKAQNFKNIPFNAIQLEDIFEQLLNFYDNAGYPFASLSLDSIVISNQQIAAVINANPYQQLTYDSLQVVGSAKVSSTYLSSYLNIKPGYPYNEANIQKLDNKLKELSFIDAVKPVEVQFKNEKAVVNLYLNKKNANQFDGILGLLPDNQTGKLQLVGNLRLKLLNAFKKAEFIDFNYQSLPQKSQFLKIETGIPNIFKTAFAINAGFNILKQDTTYLNTNTKLGFSYIFKGNNGLQLFVDNRNTSLISIDQYKNISVLPGVLDSKTTFYGLAFNYEQVDYRFNPQKGITVQADVSIGNKQIRKNAAINASLYDNIGLTSTTYKLQSRTSVYLPLAKQTIVALSNETGVLSENNLTDNEIFRLGGLHSLRGFNELSILASSYTFFSGELRYLLEQNSFLFAFYNQAYVRQKTININQTDYPLGFGAGINFQTNLGIISMSYALGKQQNNPITLQQGKIHFGIIALF